MKRQRVSKPNANTGIETELKYKDYYLLDQTVSKGWTGAMLDPQSDSISGVNVGNHGTERDGRQYTLRSIHVRGFIKRPATLTNIDPPGDNFVRLAVMLDNQTNGTQMNSLSAFTTISDDADINAFRNLDYSRRFTTLSDQRILIDYHAVDDAGTGNYAAGARQIPFEVHHVFKTPLDVNCNGLLDNIDFITDNSIHVLGCTNSRSLVQITYNARLRFTG